MPEGVVPRIVAAKNVVPQHKLGQADFKAFGNRIFRSSLSRLNDLLQVYDTAGIETRYISVPLSFLENERTFEEKNEAYVQTAVPLLQEAAAGCLEAAGLDAADIDTIILVSSTGIAVPTLDVRLMEVLPFRRDVRRLPLFGLGCAGGVLGLGRAAMCALAEPGSRILFLVVELCSLTFCHGDRSLKNFIATALFGDGAAAAVLTADHRAGLGVSKWGEYTWPDTLDVMGWNLRDDGLGLLMSRSIPGIVKRHMRASTDGFLASAGLTIENIDTFACHPGGTKVINAIEEVLGLHDGHLMESRSILREYGNMSAATVFFVLERILEHRNGESGRCLMSSLGPGFSAGYAILEPTGSTLARAGPGTPAGIPSAQ